MKGRYLSDAQRQWVRLWWRSLGPAELAESSGDKPLPILQGLGRKARAELKRCHNVQELMLDASMYHLAFKLFELEREKKYPLFADNYVVSALIAGTLAHVREEPGKAASASLPSVLGRGEPVVMSELRFIRLMRTNINDDFYRQLCRALALAKHQADVTILADDIVAWVLEKDDSWPTDPNSRLKARWARDYYLPAATRATYANTNKESLA